MIRCEGTNLGFWGILSCIFLTMSTACTSVMEYSLPPLSYSSTKPFDSKVHLYIPNSLENLQWETESYGTKLIQVGKAFRGEAETMGKALFREVVLNGLT